jgi:hypothetical protein
LPIVFHVLGLLHITGASVAPNSSGGDRLEKRFPFKALRVFD